MITIYNGETKWFEVYGTKYDQCVFCDQPSTVGYADACTVLNDDEEYVIRVGLNTCNQCYVNKPRAHINRIMKQKRLEIVQSGKHLHAIS